MTQDTEMASGAVTTAAAEPEQTAWVAAVTPAVDVSETPESVIVTVDLPGVSEEALSVNVENGVMTIDGRAEVAAPAGYERVLGEYDAVQYRRVLRLSDRLDAGRIAAQLKHGVLRLTLPRREEAKARRIAITTN